MKSQLNHRQVSSIAKQAGFMPSCWLAINSLGNDRGTPEYISRVREDIV
jgi:hypothetical protein